ncbi:hypothetical protein FRC08_009003 [Ceratobasidium sp. 394]|nr:hypothetical protein FRC08_009003 [Ceratobasidium sp. 394]KAG9101795.1 hypothetical protein FS749_003098 [Ceratobasidium sp. UAMH 11750]
MSTRIQRNCSACGLPTLATHLVKCATCVRRFCVSPHTPPCLILNGKRKDFVCDWCCERENIEFTHQVPARCPDGTPGRVVLCIVYLETKDIEATGLRFLMEGQLEGLGLTVVTLCVSQYDACERPEFYNFLKDIQPSHEDSLLVCFLTEGTTHEDGGLWWRDGEHEDIRILFTWCLNLNEQAESRITRNTSALLARFKRRTLFQIACGVGINKPQIEDVQAWLTDRQLFDEIIMPVASIVTMACFQGCWSAIAVHLYHFGKPVLAAMTDGWLRNERARQQSDLLLLRPGEIPQCFVWSPYNRPLGVPLPNKDRYCDCGGNWRRNTDADEHRRFVYGCRNKACKVTLLCEIDWQQDVKVIQAHGTSYAQCAWPFETRTIKINGDPIGDWARFSADGTGLGTVREKARGEDVGGVSRHDVCA